MMREDDLIWPRLVALAGCLEREIAAAQVPSVVLLGVLPGALVVPDFCGAGTDCAGQAWVRLVRAFPSVNGFTPDAQPRVDSPLAFTVEVGILRCAPMPDSDGAPPGPQEQLEAARLQMADMNLMLRAIECCFPEGNGGQATTYQPVGPDGDCIGGVWNAAVSAVF